MRIIDYVSLIDMNDGELDRRIQELIEKGWQPFGGISISAVSEEDQLYFAQAMVKYEGKE